MRTFALLLILAGLAAEGAVVLDRVAVVVGRRVIKASDIQRDLRVSQFLNREPLNISADARRKSAQRLIDQELIRQEIANGGYTPPGMTEADSMILQIRRDRFRGSDDQMNGTLTKYGISRTQLREQLLWQLTVLRFIEQRFRPGVLVTDEDVKAYYDKNLAALQKEYPRKSSLEELEAKIRESLEGEQVNQAFTQWLDQVRQRTRVEYRQGAFE